MSLWGATVITNLLSAIPWIGVNLVEFVWGGFSVDNATLNRFFSLHYLLPFILAGLVVLHLIALHEHGSNNPLGVSANIDRVPFHPYYTFKDIVGFLAFFLVLSIIVFYMPNLMGQGMAVFNGNIDYNNNTICWNSLLLIVSTKRISGSFLTELLLKKNYSSRIPSLVKICYQDQSAENQIDNGDNLLNNKPKFEMGFSETICVTSYDTGAVNNEEFGHWLAGMIDGDGSLLVSKAGNLEIEITLHEEDVKTLYKIKSILGTGKVTPRSSSKAYRLRIRNKEGVKTVINLINGKLLTPGKHQQLIKICNLINIRPIINNSFTTKNAWFSGFFDAEGYLSIRNKYTLTLSVSQKDRNILDKIYVGFNCGNIYYDKSWDGFNYCVTKRASIDIFMEYFKKFPLLTVKNVDIVTFNRLLLFLERKYHFANSSYKYRIDHLIALFKSRKKR